MDREVRKQMYYRQFRKDKYMIDEQRGQNRIDVLQIDREIGECIYMRIDNGLIS